MRRKTRASHRLNALRSADTPALQERRASQTPQGQHALNATHLKQFENAYSETNDQTFLKIRTGANEMSKRANWKLRTTRFANVFARVAALKNLTNAATAKTRNKIPSSQMPLNRMDDPSCEFR
jgi:hypothetical protein